MWRRLALLAAALAAVLTLGAGSSEAHPLATATVTVEVMGLGLVESSPSGVSCGDGRLVCYRTFTFGGTVTLTHRNTGKNWSFDSWSGACAGDPCTLDASVSTDYLVTASFSGPATTTSTLSVGYSPTTDAGLVNGPEKTSGSKIKCGNTTSATSTADGTACSWSVLTGSTLTLFETPDSGSVFSAWAGDCGSSSVWCTVQVNGDSSVQATWLGAGGATIALDITVVGSGTVVLHGATDCHGPGHCSVTEPQNATVQLEADPVSGYVFSGWSGSDCSGTGMTCTLTMNAARTVTATFAAAVPLSLSVDGSGTVSGGAGAITCGNGADVCSATFALNSTVTLVAIPASGAVFAGWTGACGGTATTCAISMSAAKNVSATFTGGTTGTTSTGVPLTVTVSGNGNVVGGGIRCGTSAKVCSANEAPNAVVVLSATPDSGAVFTGWGGSCSGTGICNVSMSVARTVTATFSGGTTPVSTIVQLSVTVTGQGSVRGGSINCGNGAAACTERVAANTVVSVVATPATGQTFKGWSGACTGTATTCRVTLTSSRTLTATFTAATSTGGGTGGTTTSRKLTAIAKPAVKKTAKGFEVTLRFRTPVAGTANVTGRRAGRLLTKLSVHVPVGNATIGPFPVSKPGFYTFQIKVGSLAIHWRTCLGLCGAKAKAPPFRLTRGAPVVKRTGAVWSVTLRYRANAISDAHIDVRRGGELLSSHQFLAGARAIVVGPFLLGPGSYTLRLRAVDIHGRVRMLTWIADLAA